MVYSSPWQELRMTCDNMRTGAPAGLAGIAALSAVQETDEPVYVCGRTEALQNIIVQAKCSAGRTSTRPYEPPELVDIELTSSRDHNYAQDATCIAILLAHLRPPSTHRCSQVLQYRLASKAVIKFIQGEELSRAVRN